MKAVFLTILFWNVALSFRLDFFEPHTECWEECFNEASEAHQGAYHLFYNIGDQARRQRIFYGSNGTAFLLDSTIFNKDKGDDTEEILKFQKNLANLISMMAPNGFQINPFYMAQFNQDFSWSCDSWQCLSRCDAIQQLDLYVDMMPSARKFRRKGQINNACHLASRQIQSEEYECYNRIVDPMAIAIINGPIDTIEDDDGHHEFEYNQCTDNFATRLAIGTYMAERDQMEQFASSVHNVVHVHSTQEHMEALQQLTTCMKDSCCGEIKPIAPSKCIRTSIGVGTANFDRKK